MELKDNEYLIWESNDLLCVGRFRQDMGRRHQFRWRITSKHNSKITHASSESFSSKQACEANANLIVARSEYEKLAESVEQSFLIPIVPGTLKG